ncbi:MAG: CPBP family intramembrane metalloprotease [Deltaproteobacteria bacterium]|nr:CPBP family intramembrane metalloprotease [Deltaproteobacteria bacterium]
MSVASTGGEFHCDEPGGRNYAPLIEALLLLAVTLPLALWLQLPTLWLLTPLLLIAFTGRSQADYGLSWEKHGGLRFHLAVCGTIFVPYVIGHYAFGRYWLGAPFQLRLPQNYLSLIVDQLLIVGLSEETFFRGYLQTQCDRVWGRPWQFVGAQWGIGLPISAILFALCHIVHGGPARLVVFFPGLWYGWLRARTDSIVVPSIYHAVSNLLMSIMLTSFAL